MGIRKLKPVTPTFRMTELPTFEELTTDRPYKPLTEARRRTGGRNSHGHLTAKHRGGGHDRRLRLVDFKRRRHGVEAVVKTIEYDPNRTARIALLEYADGEKAYMLAPDGLAVGEKVVSGPEAEVKTGNHLPLGRIADGTSIHNVELIPGQGGRLVRSAGTVAQLMGKDGPYAHVRLPSGEVRMISLNCYATVGQCGNLDHENVVYGKAGRMSWFGRRPRTRGVAKNPVDHPMGGGQGKTSGGRHPCSEKGQLAKGLKTRRRSKPSNRYIVKDRRI